MIHRRLLMALGAVVTTTLGTVLFTSTPSFAECNQICRFKCSQAWHQAGFKSMEQCVQVWTQRRAEKGPKIPGRCPVGTCGLRGGVQAGDVRNCKASNCRTTLTLGNASPR
jgi:hypothetical protein